MATKRHTRSVRVGGKTYRVTTTVRTVGKRVIVEQKVR